MKKTNYQQNKCITANGKLICYCGNCKQEDYKLPEDFVKNTYTYGAKTTVGDMLAEHVKYEEMENEYESRLRAQRLNCEWSINEVEGKRALLLRDIKIYKWIIALISLPLLFTLWCIIITIWK